MRLDRRSYIYIYIYIIIYVNIYSDGGWCLRWLGLSSGGLEDTALLVSRLVLPCVSFFFDFARGFFQPIDVAGRGWKSALRTFLSVGCGGFAGIRLIAVRSVR